MSDAEGLPNRKRRLGFRRACLPCRQKKHRCDGGRPTCLGCTSRGIRCQYGQQTRRDDFAVSSGPPREANIRLNNRLEGENGSQNSWGLAEDSVSPYRPGSSRTNGPAYGAEAERRDRPPRGPMCAGNGSGNGNIPSPGTQSLSETDGYFGDSSSIRFVSKIRPAEPCNQTPPEEALLPREPFDTPDSSLAQGDVDHREGLPTRELADRLVDAYFERVHVLYPFLHEGTFRARYEALWADDQPEPAAAWMAVANLVFAYGHEFCAQGQHDNFAALAAPFVARAKRIVLSRVFAGADLRLVQALLLLCHYLQGTLQLSECWNMVGLMIRSAVSVGLHLNRQPAGEASAVEREERRRSWWGCFVLDRTLSMKFGRPPSILFDGAREVDLPLEVDDQYISSDGPAPRQPHGRPAGLSFFVATVRLAEIIDRILDRMYDAGSGSRAGKGQQLWWSRSPEASARLGSAVLLDGQLQAWWEDMPVHLREEPELPDGPEFRRQRLVMRIRFLQMRLLLQRPLFMLFHRGQVEDEFLRGVALSSSRVCASAARETIRLIHLYYDKQLLNSLWYNLHYIFTSLGVLVTVQTMDASLRKQLSSNKDGQALHCGMEFLRSASRNSILASRYIAMLSKPNKTPPPRTHDAHDHLPVSLHQAQAAEPDNGNARNAAHDVTVTPSAGIREEGSAEQSSPGLRGLDGLDGGFDFAHLDPMYSYNLLFGTGLPQEVLSTDWPTYEAMIP